MKDQRIENQAIAQRQKIADEYDATMAPLFKDAEERGLWFYTSYQALWFSPSELKAEHAKGSFRWGPDNWKLRDPMEMVKAIDAQRRQLNKDKKEILKRIEDEQSKNSDAGS